MSDLSSNGESLRGCLERILAKFKEADEERYRCLKEWEAEAAKWRTEGDMYGWNFHMGMGAGANCASLYFARVQRELDAMIKGLPVEVHDEHCDINDPIIKTKPCNCKNRVPVETSGRSLQAPIACIRVGEDDTLEVSHLYAPGLPPGHHDLYCEPPAPGGQKVPHPAFETEEELSPRDHALIDEAFKRHVGKTCNRPPIGWSCSREVGHDGPCAASPLKTTAPLGFGIPVLVDDVRRLMAEDLLMEDAIQRVARRYELRSEAIYALRDALNGKGDV